MYIISQYISCMRNIEFEVELNMLFKSNYICNGSFYPFQILLMDVNDDDISRK